MTTYMEHSSVKFLDSVAALPRFPANKAGASLLAIIQSALDGVIVIDATRQIVMINDQAEDMFGYAPRQLLDKSVDVLLPPRIGTEQRRRMERRLASVRMSGRRTRLGLRAMHASGQEFAVTASISRIMVGGEMFLAVIMRNAAMQAGAGRKGRPVRSSDFRKLAVSSQQANELEKRRFSKELYDDIGQRLSVLKLDLDWLEHRIPGAEMGIPARVAQMQGMLDNVITLTKSMASALRPPLLDDFGLMPAVEWMADNFQKKNAIACKIERNDMMIKLGDPVKSTVFRVIQEGLLNIERHAQARNVVVALERTDKQLDVLIKDDGIGMAAESENKPGCYGLIAMQERIFILGGTITIKNIKPQGVAIHASIPIDSQPAQYKHL